MFAVVQHIFGLSG